MKLKQNHPLSAPLVLSLLLNESGGNILYDATGNQNNGIGTNIAWGRGGLDLAGDNENITVPNFIGQDADWTIFMLFTQDVRNPNAQAADTMLASMKTGTGSVGRAILFIDDRGTPTYKLRSFIDGVNHPANTVIDVGKEYTCGLTQEGTSFHFYLNGVDDGNFTATADTANGDIILFDHRNNPGTGCLDGTVGVIHWFDRALTAEEMKWLDWDSLGMFEPDPIARPFYVPSGDIDTENKRRSVMGTPWAPMRPLPDGTIAALDRIHTYGLYAGILSQSPATGNLTIFGQENGINTLVFGGQVCT